MTGFIIFILLALFILIICSNDFFYLLILVFIIELILITLIIADWRKGEGRRWAYPIALVAHVAIQLLMFPVSYASWWDAFCQWFAAGPMGG